jgi:hypothetical protein
MNAGKRTMQLSLLARPKRFKANISALYTEDHEPFEGVCEAYGEKFRPIFLKIFTETFLRDADQEELAVLRKAISTRARASRQTGRKRGRPSALQSRKFLLRAGLIASRRYVAGQKWSEIAKALDFKSGELRTHIWTMKRQLRTLGQYFSDFLEDDESIQLLSNSSVRKFLQEETGLPFCTHLLDCMKVVIKLLQLIPEKQGNRIPTPTDCKIVE